MKYRKTMILYSLKIGRANGFDRFSPLGRKVSYVRTNLFSW